MSDLIDRQALLKTLNENKIEFDSDVNYFIMHAPSVNQWIPCSERLPEDGDYVIVTVWEGSVMIAWRDHNEWETESFSLDDGEVNAWMPLPGPWKGEENA